MFNTEKSTVYYLYDKIDKVYRKTFNSMSEIKNYLKTKMIPPENNKDIPNFSSYFIHGSKMFKNISMDFENHYYTTYSYIRMFDPETTKYILKEKEKVVVHYNQYVIIDKDYRIFNYTEIYYELLAEMYNRNISFGEGKTYPGPSTTPAKIKPWNYNIFFYGSKSHRKGSGSYRLIVNKSERIATLETPKSVVNDLANEIRDELMIDIDEKMIDRACNSMRSRRKAYTYGWCEDVSTDEFYRYGNPSSWKNSKKSKQWKTARNVVPQTAFKDYLKDYVDKEYSYTETEDEEYDY